MKPAKILRALLMALQKVKVDICMSCNEHLLILQCFQCYVIGYFSWFYSKDKWTKMLTLQQCSLPW